MRRIDPEQDADVKAAGKISMKHTKGKIDIPLKKG